MSTVNRGQDLSIELHRITVIHQNQPRLLVQEHHHDRHEILIPISGSFEVILGERKYVVAPEQMFWLPEGTKHAFTACGAEDGERIIVLFDADIWQKRKGTKQSATIFPSHQLIKEIAFYLLAGSQKHSSLAMTRALIGIISDVVGQHPEISEQSSLLPDNQTVKKAMSILAEEFTEELSIDDLASRVGIAARTLSRLFAEHVGISPKQVLIRHRVQEACRLLRETRMTMTDVAFEAGFGSVSRFIECFRTQVGILPSDYRARNNESF